MTYDVKIKRKVLKDAKKLPLGVQNRLRALLNDLKNKGAIQKDWSNFSALGKNKYHCHLNYRYVACWTYSKGTIEIEVYYAGSREKAPY